VRGHQFGGAAEYATAVLRGLVQAGELGIQSDNQVSLDNHLTVPMLSASRTGWSAGSAPVVRSRLPKSFLGDSNHPNL